MNEARSRWEELNKTKKVLMKINDNPICKIGIDDITVLVCYIHYNDEGLWILINFNN